MPVNTAYDQYAIGKGRFYAAIYGTNGVLGPYRFIGNVTSFTLTPSNDTITHISSISGLNVQDRSVPTSSSLAIAFATDNMSDENKALWSGGTVDPITATSQTAQTMTIAAPVQGGVYPIGVTTANPSGAKDVTVTAVTQGGTPLVAGTDYVVNGRSGLISILNAVGTSITVTYSVAASTRDQVNRRNLSPVCAIRFESDNPDTGNGKVDEEHFLPYVQLAPDGDWSLIGEDWQSFGFAGQVLQRYDLVGNPIVQHVITPLTPPA